MRIGGGSERELRTNTDVELTAADPREQLARAVQEFFPRCDIRDETWPRKEERAFSIE